MKINEVSAQQEAKKVSVASCRVPYKGSVENAVICAP